MRQLSGQIQRVNPSLTKLRAGLQQLQDSATFQPTGATASSPLVDIQTITSVPYQPSCLCRCHYSSQFQTPPWLRDVIGLLSVGYSGLPLVGKPACTETACTETACRRRRSTLLKVNYFFPSWLLHRMVVYRYRWDPATSQVITVRTPRLVPIGASVFKTASDGNLELLKSLFSQGLASPFDVNLDGTSTLKASLNTFVPETLSPVQFKYQWLKSDKLLCIVRVTCETSRSIKIPARSICGSSPRQSITSVSKINQR